MKQQKRKREDNHKEVVSPEKANHKRASVATNESVMAAELKNNEHNNQQPER